MTVAGVSEARPEYSERQQREKAYHDDKYRHQSDSGRRGRLSKAAERFWGVIGEPRGLTILDFGCGNGWLSVLMGKQGNRVYGFDISEVLVAKARELAAASNVADCVSFSEMAAEQLLYPDATFDLIIGTSILHHTDLDVTLDRIRAVLKRDGTAVFLEPLNQNVALKLWRLLTPWRRTKTERALTRQDLAAIHRAFPTTRFNYYCFTSMIAEGLLLVAPESALLGRLHSQLEALDHVLLRWFPALGRFSAVTVLEMRK